MYLNKYGLLLCLAVSCSTQLNVAHSDVEMAPHKLFSIEELKKRTFDFFWNEAYPGNLQIPDRYPTERFSSIAATGFGLTSYLVGVENQYITREQAANRVVKTLRVLSELPQGPDSSGVSGYKGFFYHFLTIDQALRYKNVELSSIDTGLLMAGIISAIEFFDQENEIESEIRHRGDLLFRRVEWDWMFVNDGKLSMGWRPERGYIPASWDGYNEAMVLLNFGSGFTYPSYS